MSDVSWVLPEKRLPIIRKVGFPVNQSSPNDVTTRLPTKYPLLVFVTSDSDCYL